MEKVLRRSEFSFPKIKFLLDKALSLRCKFLDIFLNYIEHFGIYVDLFLKHIELILIYANLTEIFVELFYFI